MTKENLAYFRADMERVAQLVHMRPVPSKVQRYLRAYEAGLPQDITVRWFPKDSLEAIQERVVKLTNQNDEVWISQGLPASSLDDRQLSSIEQRTDLIKGLGSLDDFRKQAVPLLVNWPSGSWAKVFHDTPRRALVGGTIRFDTNRKDSILGSDTRSIRLEAASGISDVRDLDRQLFARQVMVMHLAPEVGAVVAEAAADLGYTISRSADTATIQTMASAQTMEPFISRNKPSEPKVIMLDLDTSSSDILALVRRLKSSPSTSCIPIVGITKSSSGPLSELRSLFSSWLQWPFSKEEVRASVYMTGFRVSGGSNGLHFPNLGLVIHREMETLVNTVFGPGGAYRRMMVQIANAEQRPTIAFEFKFIPSDPCDFFFLDYEWSGMQDPLHRFDWVYQFGDGD